MEMTVYTVREFRARMKEAFDKAGVECVHIKRGKDIWKLERVHSADKQSAWNSGEPLSNKILCRVSDVHGCGCKKSGPVLCKAHGRL